MIERPEAPVLDENPQSFTFTMGIQGEQQGAVKWRDPIFELFNPPADARDGKCMSGP